MRKIITRDLKNIKRYLTGGGKIITLGFKILTLSFLGLSFGLTTSNSVFAETMKSEVNIKPSMTLDVPVSSINLNLDPATNAFTSKDINITVGTNNKTGYWISMSSSTGESDLVNIDDNTKTIPTIATAGSYTSLDFPVNQWGYKIDSGNYIPFVSGATIKSSNTTANGETFKLNIASKIDYLQPSGTYNMALNIKMLPNMTTNYIQNLDSALCTEDPMVVIDNRDEQSYIVQRLKDGKCWMMTNLNLGAVKLTQDLTSANTNIATVVTAEDFNGWDRAISGYVNSYNIPKYTTITTTNSANNLVTDSVSKMPYGTLYNSCATTAGYYCDNGTTVVDNKYTICASGWTLPTLDELRVLLDRYSSFEKMHAPIEDGGAAFTLAGQFYDTVNNTNQGNTAAYWSLTQGGKVGTMARLYLDRYYSTAAIQYDGWRDAGRSVRCLLKES